MSLTSGTKLGPYEIQSALGAGGMGEVYRARDTRLGRDVAVKVLPESFARDAERMRRFEQEARAVAALSHANVLAIYDTGMHEGMPYLVTELLEGETLRERLKKGPVPARKAVEYARQVADGLAAAHEKGVVHRDLKPENLFLGDGGQVKILDFGLAKLQPAQAATAGEGATATMAVATTPGMVMGTTGYMAPEQVRGEAVDHRADIFSFGATLYEMLSGERAFKGDTSVETMNAILKEEPRELESERLHVAPGLERIVHHCLEKKPGDRFQSARDLTFALGALSGTAMTSAMKIAARPSRRWLPAAGAAAIVLVLAAAYWLLRPAATAERAQFAIPVPGEINQVAISTDGRWLAFISPGETGSEHMLYVQRIGTAESRALPGTEGASYPFWSPDDAYVAFFADGKLKKIGAAGGVAQTLARVSNPRGGSWGRKGVIIYAPDTGGGLWRVNADGNGAAPFTEKLVHGTSQRWPVFLPDGEHFILFDGKFDESSSDRATGIYLSSLAAERSTELCAARSSAGYGGGRVYYVDANGALVSAALDLKAEKLAGEPRVIAAAAARSPSTYYATFAVADNSTVVYSAGGSANLSQLTWFDETGKELGRLPTVGVLANPALSPDGKRVAYDSNDFAAKNVDVWVTQLSDNSSSRFTFDPAEETTPAWSRDGGTIAYHMVGSGSQVWAKNASGLGEPRALEAAGKGLNVLPNSWSPDDKEIVATFQTVQGPELVILTADGKTEREFLGRVKTQTDAQISPDGTWVAYASNETGEWEIYVTTFPGGEGKWQVSRGGGTEPRWRGDGKAIFYLGPKQTLTAVPVNAGATFSAAAAHPLFHIDPRAPLSATDLFSYDVTRDGKRFLVNQYVKPEHVPPLAIVLHADLAEAK